MNKIIFSLALLLVPLSSWTEILEVPMAEIECSIKPIDRKKIHRKKNYEFAQSTTSSTSESFSNNWSGYVAATDFTGTSVNDTVTYAAGSWIVPTLVSTPDDSYTAIWVGIDGLLSPTVEQIGTSHYWINGAQQNFAWFEMYPQGAYELIGFPIDNGDMISVRVGYKGDDTFKLVIFNHTQGVSTAIPSSYTVMPGALRSSAEWIVEAPYSGSILPLSDFQLTTFNYCSAVINDVHGTINNGAWMNDEITMVGGTGVEARPTALLKDGSCFQVLWESE